MWISTVKDFKNINIFHKTRVQGPFQWKFFPFGLKKSVITATCDEFCKNFLSRSQVLELYSVSLLSSKAKWLDLFSSNFVYRWGQCWFTETDSWLVFSFFEMSFRLGMTNHEFVWGYSVSVSVNQHCPHR